MDAENLVKGKCKSCEGIGLAFGPEETARYLAMVDGWSVVGGKVIEKSYASKNFVAAMAMANGIMEVAEQEDHHPDLHVSYRTLRVELTTHALGGLTENDFILAAKIDQICGS
jgi:4a-hydroxytetrahydrobiopterin dehydratase